MRIDFATLAFGYKVLAGGATPNWATSLGQGKEYKINDDPEIDEMLKGLVYSSVSLSSLSTKIGKGGRMVSGDAPNSPSVVKQVHTCEKPIPLLQRLISTFSQEGDVIFDGFAGGYNRYCRPQIAA